MAKQARWYVDANALGLAHILVQVRRDVTFPGDDGRRDRPGWDIDPCVIQDPSADDQEWIPQVTRSGLAVITRDKRIEQRTAEKDAVFAYGARLFAITSETNLDNWGLLEVVVTQWRRIEAAAQEPGPYIYSMTRTSLHRINL